MGRVRATLHVLTTEMGNAESGRAKALGFAALGAAWAAVGRMGFRAGPSLYLGEHLSPLREGQKDKRLGNEGVLKSRSTQDSPATGGLTEGTGLKPLPSLGPA